MAKHSRKPKRQKPPPKCKALLLCDKTIIEALTGKVSLIGIFEGFIVRRLPGPTAPCTVFVQLTDGIGQYDLVVEIHDLKTGDILGRAEGIGLTWPEKLFKINVMIPLPPMVLQHAGTYDLVVLANGQVIERQKFMAIQPREQAPNETSSDPNSPD
jgi:hypothetical protein